MIRQHITRYNAAFTVFCLLVIARIGYPFFNNPIPHQVGLSGRQWRQAADFWEPSFMSGVDSFLYQFWLHNVREVAGADEFIVQLIAGLLCALLPVSWFLCARQLLPKGWALGVGILFAVFPSFTTIYAYFTAETLLLPLMGIAAWQTAKGYESRRWSHVSTASILWFLAALTRFAAIIPAVACLGLLLWRLRSWQSRIIAVVIVALLAGPMVYFSAWHSHKAINVYAAFGMPELNAMLTRSRAARIHIESDLYNKDKWFRSPSYHVRPLAPLSRWHIHDINAPIRVTLNKAGGKADWEREMANYPLTTDRLLEQMRYNLLFILAGPSWPDSWPNAWQRKTQSILWESDLNYWARWIWPPVILFVIYGALFFRGQPLHRWLMLLSLAMIGAFIVQTTSVFEGRYRKPVEPLLLLCSAIMIRSMTQKDEHSGV